MGANAGDTISIVVAYSNGDYNFFSNQYLGGLPAGSDNLGADGAGNFVADASATALDLSAVAPFSITVPGGAFVLGDANLDGVVTFADIPAFIVILQGGSFLDQADTNRDGAVTFADIPTFITILQGG